MSRMDEVSPARTASLADALRRQPLFEGLPEADLQRLARHARPVTVAAGETFIEEGSPGETMFIVLDGELEVLKRAGDGYVLLATHGAGAIVGEMSLLSGSPRSASVKAARASRLIAIDRVAVDDLLACNPSAALTMLRTVVARLRGTETLIIQHQKMAALGTLAAGVAHELNNPSAAIARGARLLGESLAGWCHQTMEIGRLGLDAARRQEIAAIAADLLQQGGGGVKVPRGDPLRRADVEDAVQDWLDERGIARPWELAPSLIDGGWDVERLGPLAERFSNPELATLLPWIATGISLSTLLREIGAGARQISEIVRAVKRYSYLDRAPVQEVDIHEGIENTLVILRYKLDNVRVRRDYAEDLPRIEAYASELNQVWTNLIDNAIDAMGGWGEITIRSYREGERVVVQITDSGPGIPEDLQTRIFDPFFTTKPPGAGTGLGLHIAYNLVVQQHHGDISVASKPGETRFTVSLPIHLSGE